MSTISGSMEKAVELMDEVKELHKRMKAEEYGIEVEYDEKVNELMRELVYYWYQDTQANEVFESIFE